MFETRLLFPRNHPQHLHQPRQWHLVLRRLQWHPHRHMHQLHRHQPHPRHQFWLRRHQHKFNKDMGKCYFCGSCFRPMESNVINNDFPNLGRNACTSQLGGHANKCPRVQVLLQSLASYRMPYSSIQQQKISILFITAVLSSKMEAESMQVSSGISRSIS